MAAEQPDFGGYATKAGLRCSDGRVIKKEAFQHMDGKKVPLVWMHGHSEPENVLGHALLEAREDGVYAYAYFNTTPKALHSKNAVQHEDLDSLSIYANGLKEMNKHVSHGNIKEVSLVLSGANPGAKIDYVRLQHSDDPTDYTELEDEAIIHSGASLDLPEGDKDSEEETVKHAEVRTAKDVLASMSTEQRDLVNYMIGAALESAEASAEHADKDSDATTGDDTNSSDATSTDGATGDDTDKGIAHQEGNTDVTRNLFEDQAKGAGSDGAEGITISHDDMKGITERAAKTGSLKTAVEEYALAHGIDNIEILFPDAKNVTGAPELEKRRMEWVSTVLQGTRHTPFSRIKTFSGDLTQDEARAKGYIKGNYKLEEWFGVTKRTTTPTTIYKKQKLDRDDMLDITDFDIVAFLKAEMRLMTEEEIARAILIGDGRDIGAEDKVKDPMGASDGAGIRSILNDHELFVTTLMVNVDVDGVAGGVEDYELVVDAVMDGFEFYKGSGTPTFFTTIRQLNRFLKAKDTTGRRYYTTKAEVAAALGVDKIVTVEPMQSIAGLIGIIVNLTDYNVGTDRGGELTMFDDFDIDYNQMKYLLETRLSGALVKPKSALVIRSTAATSVLVVPSKPTFVAATGVITIPTVTGVTYKDGAGTTLTAGPQTALTAGQTKTIYATANSGYHVANTVEDSWPFKRPSA